MERVHGGNPWAYGDPREYLDFSDNVNPLAPPRELERLISECVRSRLYTFYPDYTYSELKRSMAKAFGVEEDRVVPLNGASEAIALLFHALKPKNVLIAEPTFGDYRHYAKLTGCEVASFFYEMTDREFMLDVDRLAGALTSKERCMVVICNPNNPTGTALPSKTVEDLLSRTNCTVVVDESFAELSTVECAVLGKDFENLVVVKSLTKLLGVPGLRVGFLYAPESLARLVESYAPSWRVNTIASWSLGAYLREAHRFRRFAEVSREFVSVERERLSASLSKLGLQAYKSSVNFFLAKLPRGCSSRRLVALAAKRCKVLLRDASSYPGLSDAFIRVAVKGRKANDVLVGCLDGVIKEC